MAVLQTTPPPPAAARPATPGRTYRVGTLVYTRGTLFRVFLWMLWGDLCLNVMESAIPRMVPLQLQQLGASDATIGVLTVSLFSLLNWVTNPVISTWSDRTRSRWGRRVPFMLFPTPPLALFLILVGFSLNVAEYVRATAPGLGRAIGHAAAMTLPDVATLPGQAQVGIGVIAVFLVLYKLFDQFPQCVYYYLFTDVIPQETMGTFVCLFRVMATLGGVVFHYWLLDLADTHPHAVYLGCGLLYLAAFLGMSLAVQEGHYPPPPPRSANPVRSAKAWLAESFTSAFYWKYFLAYAGFRWAFVPFNLFLILYAQKTLDMKPGEFGHVMAWVLAVQLPVLFGLGPLLDKFHPIRVGLVGYATLVATGLAGFLLVGGKASFVTLTMLTFVAITIFQSAIATLGPRLLPRAKYGQFCAATMMVVESGMFVLAWACGKLLDALGERYLFLWLAAFSLFGLIVNVVLYRAWRQHGGDDHYAAPGDFDVVALETQGHQPAAAH